MQSAGDDSAVFTFSGTAAPLSAPLHPVSAGAASVSERLHQVNTESLFFGLCSLNIEQDFKRHTCQHIFCCWRGKGQSREDGARHFLKIQSFIFLLSNEMSFERPKHAQKSYDFFHKYEM